MQGGSGVAFTLHSWPPLLGFALWYKEEVAEIETIALAVIPQHGTQLGQDTIRSRNGLETYSRGASARISTLDAKFER